MGHWLASWCAVLVLGGCLDAPDALPPSEADGAPPPSPRPVATDDHATSRDGQPVTVQVLVNDRGGALRLAAIGTPGHGRAVGNANASITYTPAPGFVGRDAFRYTIRDALGRRASARVLVSVVSRPAAIRLEARGGALTLAEAGGRARAALVLSVAPVADVAVALSTSAPALGVVSPARVVFTAADWGPREVTLTAVDDDVATGALTLSVLAAPAESDDPRYRGVVAPPLPVLRLDDDAVGVLARPARAVAVTGDGGAVSFSLRLAARPAADVALELLAREPSEVRLHEERVVFTPADWAVPQVVSARVRAGPAARLTVVSLPARSADSRYDGLNPPDVTIRRGGAVVVPSPLP